ncbi:hypothetical protein LguiA_004238 [Lonicera macranthoides]
MSKKRKSLATSLEEVDRTVYSTFCSGANSLSQLYSQAMNQQKLSFQAGERHGLEKLYQWILRQQEEGSRVAPVDIVTYLRVSSFFQTTYPAPSLNDDLSVFPLTDLDCCGEDVAPMQNQHLQATMHIPNMASSGSSGAPPGSGQGFQSEHSEQQRSKNDVFSDALSSPVRRSLQNYHIAQRNYYTNGVQNENGPNGPHSDRHQNRDPNNPVNSSDSSMDMHADSPGHDSSYRQL